MESNVNKGTKPDFSNFVALTLENRMPWKTLSLLLNDLAPTLNETREIIISILLKELEALQSRFKQKEKELENMKIMILQSKFKTAMLNTKQIP